ncbi:hypothetical protein [Brevibacterium atlanticum]|uniref:hypothetical protein n=1 Tax=Brevibacterium atlanticum TaxID=2697563 RepID=UPI002B1BD1B7|nr:hypothetical protein [Brevibacterium atlanticum]
MPSLPTTTVGSFPQTAAVRRARADHRRMVDVHRDADGTSGQGYAHRPGDDPRVVLRPR